MPNVVHPKNHRHFPWAHAHPVSGNNTNENRIMQGLGVFTTPLVQNCIKQQKGTSIICVSVALGLLSLVWSGLQPWNLS